MLAVATDGGQVHLFREGGDGLEREGGDGLERVAVATHPHATDATHMSLAVDWSDRAHAS